MVSQDVNYGIIVVIIVTMWDDIKIIIDYHRLSYIVLDNNIDCGYYYSPQFLIYSLQFLIYYSKYSYYSKVTNWDGTYWDLSPLYNIQDYTKIIIDSHDHPIQLDIIMGLNLKLCTKLP